MPTQDARGAAEILIVMMLQRLIILDEAHATWIVVTGLAALAVDHVGALHGCVDRPVDVNDLTSPRGASEWQRHPCASRLVAPRPHNAPLVARGGIDLLPPPHPRMPTPLQPPPWPWGRPLLFIRVWLPDVDLLL